MEPTIFKFIWRHSKAQQIFVLLITVISFPILYATLEADGMTERTDLDRHREALGLLTKAAPLVQGGRARIAALFCRFPFGSQAVFGPAVAARLGIKKWCPVTGKHFNFFCAGIQALPARGTGHAATARARQWLGVLDGGGKTV